VFHIGSGTLQAIEAQQTQADDVFADFGFLAVQRELQRIGQHHGLGIGQLVMRGRRQGFYGHALGGAGGFVTGAQIVAIGFGTAAEINDAVGIEVHIGQSREECLRRVGVDFSIDHADFACGHGIGRNGLQQVNQHVLQVGYFTRLATHAARIAAAIALGGTDRVFTLHAKHENSFGLIGVEIEGSNSEKRAKSDSSLFSNNNTEIPHCA